MSVARHIFGTIFRALLRIVVTALICAVIAIIVVLAVSYATLHQWPPHQLTTIATVGFAVLAAYAGGLTVLLVEAVRGFVAATRAVERDGASLLRTVEGDALGALHPTEQKRTPR